MTRAGEESLEGNRLLRELHRRQAEDRPVRVAIVGSGDYGETVAAQIGRVPGLQLCLVCDLDPERARRALELSGAPASEVRFAESGDGARLDIESGRPVATTDPAVVAESSVELVVECTGDPEAGTRIAAACLERAIHVVMVNAEADATAGWILARQAHRSGCVYTLADGDQPSLLAGLCNWAALLGLEVVTAGKWTRSHPPEEARRLLAAMENPSPSDVTNLDGSKTQIELAAAANALGFAVDIPGMHGRSLNLARIPEELRPRAQGGILGRNGVVDYVNTLDLEPHDGHRGGVFSVVTCSSERTKRALAAKNVPVSRDGEHLLLFRAQHLVGAETIRSIALATIDGEPTASSRLEASVEVVAVAKRPLRAGEVLVGLAGDDVAGVAYNSSDSPGYLPVGMAAGTVLREDVSEGELLRVSQVAPREGSFLWQLRGDELLGSEAATGGVASG